MGTVSWWTGIEASSPVTSYTGEWDTSDPVSYRPRATFGSPANATLDFSGSGVGWKGNGTAGRTSAEGVVFSIDAGSSSPFQRRRQGELSLQGQDQNQNSAREYGWDETKVPPGEHHVVWSATSETVSMDFTGFVISLNGSVTSDFGPGTYLASETNVSLSEGEFFGERSRSNQGNAIYITGENSGFAFNFTGAGVAIRGPPVFNETSSWAVYLNATSPTSETKQAYARHNATGGTGRGGTIFFAAALPQGQHRVLVVREDGELAFSGATVYWPQIFTNNTLACFSSCGDGESKRGIGVGMDFQQATAENGASSSTGLSLVPMLVSVAMCLTVL